MTEQFQSKSAAAIDRAKSEGRAALVGYLPAGYPTVQASIDAGIALARNGADLIEIGIPYSDPVMDGPVIQAATTEAINNGFRVSHVFDVVAGITAATDAAVLVMTYWNPVMRMGVDEFSRRLAEAGEQASLPRTSFPTKPLNGSKPRTSTAWTACSWWPRPPRPSAWT